AAEFIPPVWFGSSIPPRNSKRRNARNSKSERARKQAPPWITGNASARRSNSGEHGKIIGEFPSGGRRGARRKPLCPNVQSANYFPVFASDKPGAERSRRASLRRPSWLRASVGSTDAPGKYLLRPTLSYTFVTLDS